MFYDLQTDSRGVTLLDTVVGVALMLVIFLGIAAAFELSIDVVTNNKARTSAIALANERMEYVRSISYASIGTSGGVPAGVIPQSETVSQNGVTFTRRTYIGYGDDPADGRGAADANGIPEDYKSAKIDVSWTTHNSTRHVTIVSRFESPNGMEVTCSPCGTLAINAVNAASQPVAGAAVTIANGSTTPPISLTTFADASGTAMLIGAPVAAGFQITVTKPGYSTARTYGVTSQNTNPNPGNLTVANAQTTTGSFAIDVLGQKTVSSWTQILTGTWTDPLSDSSKIATSSNTALYAGAVRLSGAQGSYPSMGSLQSVAIAPAALYRWRSFSTATSTPASTSLRFQFYDGSGTILIPDAQLPGNAAGFATSSVNLSGVSTTTYPSIAVVSTLFSADPANTPSIDSYTITYDYGPNPLPSIPFTLQLNTSIGSGPSGTVYKYAQDFSTGASSRVAIPNLEWGTYDILVPASSGYDVASSCQPASEYSSAASTTRFSLVPGAQTATSIYLAAHTTYSLLVDVKSAQTGVLIPGANVMLSRTGYSSSLQSDGCGQAFFPNLAAASYSLTVSAAGYTTWNATNISVAGTGGYHVTLN